MWDFTRCDTLAESHIHQNSLEAGSAANAAEARKETHYSDLMSDYIFAPIALETIGSVGTRSAKFIYDLSRRLIVATGDKRAGHYFRQRLGLAVQRGNALAVLGTMDRGQCLADEVELDDGIIAEAMDRA